MAGSPLPTPLYGLYRAQLGFSELMVTVVFAVYALGVIATLLLAGNVSDEAGRRPVLLAAWASRPPARSASSSRAGSPPCSPAGSSPASRRGC
ncbi:hypothetical protein SCALM49S_02933 [Streptomyces californicus]